MVRRYRYALIVILLLLPVLAGGQSVDLDTLLEQIDANFDWDPYREVGVFRKGPFRLSFRPGDPTAILNFSRTVHLPGVSLADRTIVFSPESAEEITSIFLPSEEDSRRRVGAIFIDPGHGGRDPGAIGRHTVDGVTLETLTKEQSEYIGVPVEGPYKPEHYRY